MKILAAPPAASCVAGRRRGGEQPMHFSRMIRLEALSLPYLCKLGRQMRRPDWLCAR